MDILKKIADLRTERNWTEYELAQRSGLPQSTISSWYRKNTQPSIASLEKICHAYGITLSQFFSENTDIVVSDRRQLELLHEWNRLEDDQKNSLLDFLKKIR